MDELVKILMPVILSKGIDKGYEFLKKYKEQHKSAAEQKIENNILDLLRILDKRIKEIENNPILRSAIDDNLKEPDVYFLLSKSFYSTSAHSYSQKTNVIVELLVKRLTNKSHSEENLLIASACEKIALLSSRHLKILAFLYSLGFSPVFESHREELNINNLDASKLSDELKYFLDLDVVYRDFTYLKTVDVVEIEYRARMHLEGKIFKNSMGGEHNQLISDFLNTEVGVKLKEKFESENIGKIYLTPVGMLIGKIASELLKKGSTEPT